MLILTRRIGEKMMIGEAIIVTVIEIKGDQVRVGIAAPIDIPVHREEVYERIDGERKAAARSAAPAS